MRRAMLGLGASLLLATGGHAADKSAPAPEIGFQRIREAELRADLTFLASDALRGRMSLDPGDQVAVEWLAAEFAKAGLTPLIAGAQGYLQPVPLIEYRPNLAANAMQQQMANIETLAASNQLTTIPNLMQAAEAELARVQRFFQKVLEGL